MAVGSPGRHQIQCFVSNFPRRRAEKCPNFQESTAGPARQSFAHTVIDFKARGGGDFLASHDLEDVVSVVNGRETLSAEVRTAGAELRGYMRREIAKLLANPGFIDALPVFLLPDTASQMRIGIVLERMQNLASI